MLKKLLCIMLSLQLLFGCVPLDVFAHEDTGSYTGEYPTVVEYCGEEMGVGMTLKSASGTAAAYPNNPPEWVDTVEEKVDWIAEKCQEAGVTGQWETALWLHDWLIYNANYDYTYTNYDPDGVLLQGTGVCESYARAYLLLLRKFDIECGYVASDAMNHAWNMLKIDGEWCHVDATWDDPSEGGYENHAYFGMTDHLMSKTHTWGDTGYTYPVSTSNINYYPIRMGQFYGETKEEIMVNLSQAAKENADVFYLYRNLYDDLDLNIYEIFCDWYYTYDWKFGMTDYTRWWTQDLITIEVTRTDPWEKPYNFDETHTHGYVKKVTAPTCIAGGFTTYICACDHSYVADWTHAAGHVYSGESDQYCDICGANRESAPVPGHIYDNNVDGTCNVCGANRAEMETREVVHMFRMYNPNTGEHFYTGSEEERDNLIGYGWQYEGVGFTFPANTGAPVHRLFHEPTGEHLYTMDEAEKNRLIAEGWNYEGIAFNSAYDTEAVQHRLHNPNATVGAYHFTFSGEEKQNLIDAGWEYQGIGWYSCWK